MKRKHRNHHSAGRPHRRHRGASRSNPSGAQVGVAVGILAAGAGVAYLLWPREANATPVPALPPPAPGTPGTPGTPSTPSTPGIRDSAVGRVAAPTSGRADADSDLGREPPRPPSQLPRAPLSLR